jgi:hypothetical protein
MNRAGLEHILRAAAAVTNQRDIVVIGSRALLGQYPNAPDPLLSSIEADSSRGRTRLRLLSDRICGWFSF